MQKVMVKGLARDEKSLKEAGVVAGSKILVVGSTFDDVLALSQSSTTAVKHILLTFVSVDIIVLHTNSC